MKAGDILNWPADVPFQNIKSNSAAENKKLHELVKADKLDFSQEFLNRIQINPYRYDQIYRSDIVKYLQDKLSSKLGVSIIRIPWSEMKTGDIINWPSDMELKDVRDLRPAEVTRLHELVKDDILDISTECLNRLKVKSSETSIRDQLKLDIVKYLRGKLARKSERPRIRIPWLEMKAGDILNWPPDVDFRKVSKLKLEDLEKLNELVKADKLDFSPEFLHRFQLQRRPSNNQYRYDRKFRSDIVKYLQDKLSSKFNVTGIRIPWSEIKAGDILNWPDDVQIQNIKRNSAAEITRLHELVKADELDFSQEFLNRLQLERNSPYRYDRKIRSDIVKYLQEKLSSKLAVPILRIPWSEMKEGDIIDWPPDVQFQNFYKIDAAEFKRLYELVKADKLDFSEAFINRLKNPHEAKNVKMNLSRDQLKSVIVKYLRDKLSSKLNVPIIRLPWSEMKAGDILNWPPDVELRIVDKLKLKDLERLHELFKADKLDFSPEFLHRIQLERMSSNDQYSYGLLDKIRSEVVRYLQDKLSKKSNVGGLRIPWSGMKPGDILNWPSDVELKRASDLRAVDVKRLHELVKEDKLDFSPEFISRFESERSNTPKKSQLKLDILTYLRKKLARKSKMPIIGIPWSKMKAGDILHWPAEVDYRKVSELKFEELEKLNELVKADKLDFSPEFINRLKLESRKTSRRDPRDQLKLDIIKHLQDKLSSKLNVPRIRIPWLKIKAADIINWPADVPIQNIKSNSAAELTRLHELVKADKLDFSSDFIKRLQNGKRTSN
jgi:isopentenyldiphosphate isomerase